MKKSLIIRWIIIGAIVLGWTVSMFPIKDRDILAEFTKLAERRVAEYEKDARVLEEKGGKEKVAEQLRAISDKSSSEYLELLRAYNAPERIANYQELKKRLDAELKALPESLSAEDRAKMSYRILEKAAGTNDGKQTRISLNHYVKVSSNERVSNANVLRYLRRLTAGRLTLGLDLQGGTEFVVGFDADEVLAKNPKANIEWTRDQIRTILDNRLNKLGVTEPEIRVEGPTSISVKMPAVSEGDKAGYRKTIQDSAKLSFHLLQPGMNPATNKPYEMMTVTLVGKSEDGEETENDISIRKEPTEVLGSDIERAVPQQDQYGRWSVGLSFNKQGAEAFGRVTGENVGQQLAIVLDGKVYSAPTIQNAITGGSAQITGDFTLEEARQLATVISSGNLPADIRIISEFGTDPTLGADAVRSGLLSGIIGLLFVIVFMLWYYRVAGAIAIAALVVNTLLVLGSMSLLKATITMPGIAGMVLTVGMAVDANVLVFERIREELSKGKALANAVKSGYERAFSSIFDSNLTTLITCFFLYHYGSGSIKGFAVTLSCGIFASMFTAIMMTRAIFDLLLYADLLHELPMRSVAFLKAPHIDFLKYRKLCVRASIAVIVVSLVVMVLRGNSMLSIEFAGGTQISYSIGQDAVKPAVEDIRAKTAGLPGMEQAQIGYKKGEGGTEILEITTPIGKEAKTDEEKAAEKAAIDAYEAANQAFAKADQDRKDKADALAAANDALAAADKALAEAKEDGKEAAAKAQADAKAAMEKAAADAKAAVELADKLNLERRAKDSELAKVQNRIDPNQLLDDLQKAFPDAKMDVGGTKIVGAHVGSQFRTSAIVSAILSLLGVICYLAFRFEFKYGLAAVIAVIHDAICACGLYVIFGGRINPSVIAALMTIVGYSLNDTIVIFDRIREMKELSPDMKFADLVNAAVNATLSRTLLTTLTTVLVVATIMLFSGGDIQNFATVMFMGLFIGTYSTIFIASAFINSWQKKANRRASLKA